VVGHVNVAERFHRYDATEGYNQRINARQFRGRRNLAYDGPDGHNERWGIDWVWPDVSFVDRLALDLGGREAVLFHVRGETDDHAWLWLPERRAICGGDFLTWVFPNAGNPQKVQRYPAEWARAMRAMAALEPELFLPAHGLPIEGRDRIHRVLTDVAEALESLVSQTLNLMNSGASLDEVLRTVRLDSQLAERPYLQATYDEPEFVVHNIWRLYGGWWDGDPSHLKPAASVEVSAELSALAGGAQRLAERASQLSADGQHRVACHLIEMAAQAEPTNTSVHAVRSEVYRRRREGELSLMAKAIYAEAADRSAAIAGVAGVSGDPSGFADSVVSSATPGSGAG
jgi:alkyl sulfatase BDS1-like metallo-beta-lactamase superfamily hydrolase